MGENSFGSRGVLAAASLAIVALAPARAQETGVLWETTAQAEIPGMPVKLPAYTAKYCAKETWTQPPETSQDSSDNCRTTSFEQTPTQVKWSMTCDAPPMTGDGEINFDGTDAYAGVVRMNAEQVSMTINLTGKKIGTCDNPE